MSGPRQLQRDATGTRADVQHRAGGAARQLLPQLQVGAIATALEVVPDDPRGRLLRRLALARIAHDHELLTSPRATSSSRSESMAVYVGSA